MAKDDKSPRRHPKKRNRIRNYKPVRLWEAHPAADVEILIDKSPVDGGVWLHIANPVTEVSDGWTHPDEVAAKRDALKRTGLAAIDWKEPRR